MSFLNKEKRNLPALFITKCVDEMETQNQAKEALKEAGELEM
jgi:hypothetical protein